MRGISFVTDDKGKRTGLFIDLKELSKRRTSGRAVTEYINLLEDLKDVIDAAQRVNEPSIPWATVKERLKEKGKLSKEV